MQYLKETTFRKLASLFYKYTGIKAYNKKYLFENRLSRLVGENKEFRNFEKLYEAILQDSSGNLRNLFIQLLVTNYTYFFRESIHFSFVRWYVRNHYEKQEYIHIWSNGCSTGEEAYSIAISALIENPNLDKKKFKVLATDIAKQNILKAIEGRYSAIKFMDGTPQKGILKKFFIPLQENEFRIHPDVRQYVYFRILNTLDPLPFTKKFDIVFLRNVLIYFGEKEKKEIIANIYPHIKKNGYLVVSLSENLVGVPDYFQKLKYSIYKKK